MFARHPGTAVRLTLDRPAPHGTFLRLLEPTPVDALDTAGRDALGPLAAEPLVPAARRCERLVPAAGGWTVTLASRARPRPAPARALRGDLRRPPGRGRRRGRGGAVI
ncbi:hypothetical protein ACFY8B_11850 [Streptomyces sp. NPDC012751]|uniref:hypothetical protein n=1 Tax=Streptomyces sp. NPDC012751 TaxID=3364846 RepID=UPI0036BB9678